MDFYVILGLAPGASPAEIKRAYRRLSRRYHPGVNPGDRQAEALFEQITEAYQTLSDPERRSRYDTAGGVAGPPQPGAFEFAGFDFSFAARGTDAATFSELFADVLHPMAHDEGKAEAGADLYAALTISFAVRPDVNIFSNTPLAIAPLIVPLSMSISSPASVRK